MYCNASLLLQRMKKTRMMLLLHLMLQMKRNQMLLQMQTRMQKLLSPPLYRHR